MACQVIPKNQKKIMSNSSANVPSFSSSSLSEAGSGSGVDRVAGGSGSSSQNLFHLGGLKSKSVSGGGFGACLGVNAAGGCESGGGRGDGNSGLVGSEAELGGGRSSHGFPICASQLTVSLKLLAPLNLEIDSNVQKAHREKGEQLKTLNNKFASSIDKDTDATHKRNVELNSNTMPLTAKTPQYLISFELLDKIFSLVMSRWFPLINNTPTFDLDSINAKSKKQYEEIAERSRDEVVSLSQRKTVINEAEKHGESVLTNAREKPADLEGSQTAKQNIALQAKDSQASLSIILTLDTENPANLELLEGEECREEVSSNGGRGDTAGEGSSLSVGGGISVHEEIM